MENMIHGINNWGLVGPETETMYCVTFLWIVDCVMAQCFEAYCCCLNSMCNPLEYPTTSPALRMYSYFWNNISNNMFLY